jgi:predicted NUDIX family NTP pyrophosphohydrolase
VVSRSAGLLLFRRVGGQLEVLVGHMGGPYWAARDAGAWTIPKGECAEGEDPHSGAVREFTEEVGCPPPPGDDIALGEVRQRGGKIVTVWAREGDLDPPGGAAVVEIEWPPHSGRRLMVPELDRVAWLPIARARELVVAAQAELLDRLVAHTGQLRPPRSPADPAAPPP